MDYVASAVMQTELKTVTPTLTLAELEERFVSDQLSGYPVVDGGKVVGVVSRIDVIRALHPELGPSELGEGERLVGTQDDRSRQLRVQDVMSRDVISVGPNDRLHDLATLMYRKRIHRVLVIDGGELVGVVTPFDFVRLYSHDRIGTEGRPDRTRDF